MASALLETDLPATHDEPATGLIIGPEHLRGGEPAAWRAEARSSAWQRFESLPMPARTDEAWRFSPLKALELGGFHGPQPVPAPVREELARRSTGLSQVAGRLAFANDATISRTE